MKFTVAKQNESNEELAKYASLTDLSKNNEF